MERVNKRWTNEELVYLKENYKRCNKEELQSFLGRSWNAIYKKVIQLGLDQKKYAKEYKYKVGEEVELKYSTIKILKQIKMNSSKIRGYEYICLKDNYVGKITEYNLIEEKGCPVCSNKKVVKGVNDIATTHPEYIKYFKNREDAYRHTISSGKVVTLVCPNCKYEKDYKIATAFNTHRFSCDICSDGISYGEKFIINLLNQAGLRFKTQYTDIWCENKRYDFLVNNDIIIEVNGMQHYEDKKFNMHGTRSLEEEKINDTKKKNLALKNGFSEDKYIIIDCRYSELNYIKNSILNSSLNKLIDLNKIDWDKCHESTFSSNIIQSCEMFNKGMDTKGIAKKLNVSRDVVRKWLNKCSEIGLCAFDGKFNSNNGSSKRIMHLDKIYNSISEASRDTGYTRRRLSSFCKDENNKEWKYV